MKYNINKKSFNGKKYKLKVLVPILCGTLLATGCSFQSYDPNDIGYDEKIEDDIQTKRYGFTIVYNNLEYINMGDLVKDDYIYFFDENDKFFDIAHIFNSTYEATTYVPNYTIKSEAIGLDKVVEVNLEEDEKAIIYIDYLAKTINVEKEKIHVR